MADKSTVEIVAPNLHIFSLCLFLSIGCPMVSADQIAAPTNEPAKPSGENLSGLRQQLAAHLAQPRFRAAMWGVKAVSLETGKTLFEHNADKLLKPASNAKLYTGALALDRLGPDFRIKTSLYAAAPPDATGAIKGDLIVYGRGDPSFAARFNQGDHLKALEPLAEALAAAGVKSVQGDLVGDESFFRGPPMGLGWTWDDLQHYYGAEVSALTVEDNVLDLVLKPGAKVGEPVQIIVQPATDFVRFVNRTSTAANGTPPSIELYRPVGENLVFATGRVPLDSSNRTDAVAVHDPARLFVSLLREALARRGVKVSGNLRTVRWTGDADRIDSEPLVELGAVESRPLSEILGKMMKPSQNLYAQLLLLQVGAAGTPENRRATTAAASSGSSRPDFSQASEQPPLGRSTTEELGLAEMKKFLRGIGLSESEVLLDEGSGLSRSCLLTPNATVTLLQFMARHTHANHFRESLPVAGLDGSLRNRMKGTKAAGNVRAKTGRLRYVDTLSGYVSTAAGEPLVFSFMLNNYFNPARSGRDEVDELAVLLAEFSGRMERSR
ncbi:MAG: D-alanyl-D-alanine carboxypeptidase/D-alanyl-D-alanine-endopeptidase [Verrucomicrobia bacterium]|nr:D-alanyl-D-alanine carboxypeptidase/D-alanyl-D-alanine-endopeptidase [Verrucomicrobiota bacterium]